MTLQEIFQRVIRAHLVLIGVCILLPVLLVVALEQRQTAEWSGSVRIQVDSSAPLSTTEAEALSSRVLALATTPTLVTKALAEADVDADANDVARQHVTATRLGESPVVSVTVTQPSAAQARSLAAALVGQVVTFMNNGSRPALDARLTVLDREITANENDLRAATGRIRSTTKSQQPLLLVGIQEIQGRLDQLTTERANLLQAKLSTDQAVVIDGDSPEVTQVGSALLPRAALALVLGLLVGLALAVLRETIAPRLAGVRALARALGAPVLGRLDESPGDLAGAMTRAARRQGIETVVVMGVDEKDAEAVSALLADLPVATPAERQSPASVPAKVPVKVPVKTSGRPASQNAKPRNGRPRDIERTPVNDPFGSDQVTVTALAGLPAHAERTAGVVVVSSGNSRVRDLENFRDCVTALRWPVVGIVEVNRVPAPTGRPDPASTS
jgi:capsular polysaccharide biosynthesis protein